MKHSRYSDSQIIAILNQAVAGTPVPDLCREQWHEQRFVLQMEDQVWRHGGIADDTHEGVGGRE